MPERPNITLKRDRWTAADRTAMALGCAMAVVVVVVGLRWWTSLDAFEQVLALLAIGAVVALKIALGFLAALCGVIRRP